tara:strand:+ start:393 stop:788 length:396 start_codon:yes stop_codon:yes gene_type:complete
MPFTNQTHKRRIQKMPKEFNSILKTCLNHQERRGVKKELLEELKTIYFHLEFLAALSDAHTNPKTKYLRMKQTYCDKKSFGEVSVESFEMIDESMKSIEETLDECWESFKNSILKDIQSYQFYQDFYGVKP